MSINHKNNSIGLDPSQIYISETKSPLEKKKKQTKPSQKTNYLQRLNSRQLNSFSTEESTEENSENPGRTRNMLLSQSDDYSKTHDDISKSHMHKRGHRIVARDGTILYKKTPTFLLIQSIQLGIASLIGRADRTEEHDLLMKDFTVVKTIMFPKAGSSLTPPHAFSDFRFRAFAPVAFRFFRVVFYITTDSFLSSICGGTLKELSNPGASGSIFYKTPDDCFIIKTVQHREAEFLRSLLPGYYMNVSQNNNTMLPKFYGLYSYENLGRSIRLVVMNNAIPSNVPIQEKYDLKGSTYKRMASKKEIKKNSPTLKDLDFINVHKNGFFLSPQHHENFFNTLRRDSMVLESFKIMDYSLLLGVHYRGTTIDGDRDSQPVTVPDIPIVKSGFELARSGLSSLHLSHQVLSGSVLQGVPAKTADGLDVVLYVAIIDILQRYRIAKKMEHAFKSIVTDGDMVSVHTPKFYRRRFLNFMEKYFHSIGNEGIPALDQSFSITSATATTKSRSPPHRMKYLLKASSDYPTSDSSAFNTTDTKTQAMRCNSGESEEFKSTDF